MSSGSIASRSPGPPRRFGSTRLARHRTASGRSRTGQAGTATGRSGDTRVGTPSRQSRAAAGPCLGSRGHRPAPGARPLQSPVHRQRRAPREARAASGAHALLGARRRPGRGRLRPEDHGGATAPTAGFCEPTTAGPIGSFAVGEATSRRRRLGSSPELTNRRLEPGTRPADRRARDPEAFSASHGTSGPHSTSWAARSRRISANRARGIQIPYLECGLDELLDPPQPLFRRRPEHRPDLGPVHATLVGVGRDRRIVVTAGACRHGVS